jgi:hypothetical protein
MAEFNPDVPIDPNADEYNKPTGRYMPREGRKVFAITGYHRDEAPFGKTILIGLVCVKDLGRPDEALTPPSDEGLSSSTKLVLNEKGMRWVARFAQALGFSDPFIPTRDEGHFDRVIASNKGFLIGTVEHRQYLPKGKKDEPKNYVTVSEVKEYEVADLAALGLTQDGAITDDVKALITKGETDYDDRLAKMAEAKKNPKNRSGGGASSASSGGGKPATDDEIPFRARNRHSDAVPHQKRRRSRRAVDLGQV